KSGEINQLLIGEGITEGKYTAPQGTPDAYVNAVSFALPGNKAKVSDSIKGIDLFPYTLSLSRVGTSVSDSTITIKFDYRLEKDTKNVINPDDYKVIMELKDINGEETLETTFGLEVGETASNTGNNM